MFSCCYQTDKLFTSHTSDNHFPYSNYCSISFHIDLFPPGSSKASACFHESKPAAERWSFTFACFCAKHHHHEELQLGAKTLPAGVFKDTPTSGISCCCYCWTTSERWRIRKSNYRRKKHGGEFPCFFVTQQPTLKCPSVLKHIIRKI